MKIISIKKTRSQRKMLIAFFVTLVFIFGNIFSNFYFAEALFNKQINYQGKLTDASNVAVVDGTYIMEFKLYDDPSLSGVHLLWTETRNGANEVTVTNGLFSIMLGEVNSLAGIDFNQTLYLGVKIESDAEMTPRKKLGAVPAAVMAETVTGAAQTAITSLGNLTGLTVTGGSTLRGLTVDNATITHDRIGITAAALGAARFDGTITNEDLTAIRTWTLPDNSGTFALTSDLTSGYVPYTGGTSNVDLGIHNLTVDTNSLFVDSVNHRVGIGTTSPSGTLNISSTGFNYVDRFSSAANQGAGFGFRGSRGSLGTPLAVTDGDIVGKLSMHAYDGSAYLVSAQISAVSNGTVAVGSVPTDLTFSTSASSGVTERMRILSDGNVGIGTTSPGWPLTVKRAAGSSGGIRIEGDSTITGAPKVGFYDSSDTSAAEISWAAGKMGITGGDVGIGTTNPGTLLHVTGSGAAKAIKIETTTAHAAFVEVSSNSGAMVTRLQSNSAAGFVGTMTNNRFDIVSNGVERISADTAGNVGIGTTIPATKLDIGSSQGNGIQMTYDTTQDYRAWIRPYWNSGVDTRIDFAIANTSGATPTTMMSVGYNGNVGIGTTTPGVKLQVKGNSGSTVSISAVNNDYVVGSTGTGIYMSTGAASGDTYGFIQADKTGSTVSADLVLQRFGGNVGIGTTSPVANLDVRGANSVAHSTGNLYISSTDSMAIDKGGHIVFGASYTGSTSSWFASIAGRKENATDTNVAGYLQFSTRNGTSTANAERMRIDSNGNVGIGTTTPNYTGYSGNTLSIASSAASGGSFESVTTAVDAASNIMSGLTFVASANTSGVRVAQIRANTEGTTALNRGAALGFYTKLDGGSMSERMHIDNGGKVGIGTTSPGAKLDVRNDDGVAAGLHIIGDFNRAGGTDAQLILGYYGDGAAVTTPVIYSGNSKPLAFATGSAERMRIDSAGKVLINATSDTSDAKLYINGSTATNGSSSAIAGILGGYTFTNGGTAGYVQVGNRFVVTNSPTTNANTAVGEMVRMVDGTSLSNLVRGLDITANAGSNTAGTNTGIRASGATFGVQGITSALAGGQAVPAALYGESTGTTQGDVLRLYSGTMTNTTTFATFYHTASAFTGTGLLMDFAVGGSGTFTGNFMDLKNNGASVFKVTSTGVTSIGLSGTASTNAVCSSLANTTAPTASVAYELRDCSGAPAADYAEMYPVETGIEYGDIVALGTDIVETYDIGENGEIDWTKIKGNISKLIKSKDAYQQNVIGIVSNNTNNFSSTGYNIKVEDNPMPVALVGRVPVKISQNSSPIKVGDYITTSMEEGKATRALKSGFVIGKALEDWTPESGKDGVMVFIEQGYYESDSAHEFVGEVKFGGLTFFDASVEFAKSVKFADQVEFEVPPLFNSDSAGFAVIKMGSDKVDVTFDKAYIAQPVVSANIAMEDSEEKSMTDDEARTFFAKDIQSVITNKTQNKFTIRINKIAEEDIRFSWIALAVKNPKVFESVMPGLVVEQGTTLSPSSNNLVQIPVTDLTASVISSTDTSPVISVPQASQLTETVDNSTSTPTEVTAATTTPDIKILDTTIPTTPIPDSTATTTIAPSTEETTIPTATIVN